MTAMFDTFASFSVAKQAKAIADGGYHNVGLYLFNSSVFKKPITTNVVSALKANGIKIVSVYENGSPIKLSYFVQDRGERDGKWAMASAKRAGQPEGSCIYFAFDYDAAKSDLETLGNYMAQARANCPGYEHGAYGSGMVLEYLLGKGLISKTWLSQSKGFAGYEGFKAKANIVQGPVTQLFGMDCDEDTIQSDCGSW